VGDGGTASAQCWDLDDNGACDLVTEDRDKNGVCDWLDCVPNDAFVRNGNAGKDAGVAIDGPTTIRGTLDVTGKLRVFNSPIEHATYDASWNGGGGYAKVLSFRSGSPLRTYAQLDSYGGFVLDAPALGYGFAPISGPGLRFMWYPFKGAFRAGLADGSAQFDDANLGFLSWAGGNLPLASGNFAFAFGDGARATGVASIALGEGVTASGDNSMALGQRASTNGHAGAFVWGDATTNTLLNATAPNQFSVRASGGIRLFTNATGTAGVTLAAGGSGWNVVSDRNAKTDLRELEGEEVLGKLSRMSIPSWSYKEEVGKPRHVGPMAQDFHAAFGLGSDDKSINSLDIDGINMAAVKALEKRTADLAATTRELSERTREIEELRNQVATMRRDMDRMMAARKTSARP
jgi:hypothetical protein